MQWELLDEGAQLYRAEYPVGDSASTSLAVGVPGGLLLVSPPGGSPAADALYDTLPAPVVAALAPCKYHRMGIPAVAKRFPNAGLYAPPDARARVGALDRSLTIQPLEALRLPSHIAALVPPTLKSQDTVLRVQLAAGTAWYINDIVTNLTHLPSALLPRLFFQALGYTPGLKRNEMGWRFILRPDRPAINAWFREAFAAHPPAMFIPGHGAVTRDPGDLSRLIGLFEG